MSEKSIDVLVDGGAATAGPPLGPALGPLGVNAGQVVAAINEKTKDFKGMKVPVKVIVNTETKEYEVTVGSPPTSALVKKELGLEKGTKDGTPVGDASLEQVAKIAKMKRGSLLAKDLKGALKEVAGTCKTLGVNIEGRNPKDFIAELNEGKLDDKLSNL